MTNKNRGAVEPVYELIQQPDPVVYNELLIAQQYLLAALEEIVVPSNQTSAAPADHTKTQHQSFPQ